MRESTAGPIQRVQHPGPTSKDPKEGKSTSFLPNYPLGETKDTLETMRLEMVEQFKRTLIERNAVLIHQLMQCTFAVRREEIVNSGPPNADLKDRWPALLSEAQVSKQLKKEQLIDKTLLDLEKNSLSCLI